MSASLLKKDHLTLKTGQGMVVHICSLASEAEAGGLRLKYVQAT
jgi:hypothetical protein